MHPIPPDTAESGSDSGGKLDSPWLTVAWVAGLLVVIGSGWLALTDWVSGLVILERGLELVALFACAGYLHQLARRGTSI